MKKYNNGNDLSEKILAGVNKLADNVASTMGPGGRNVILHRKDGNPIITKDGVTVAKFIDLEVEIIESYSDLIKWALFLDNSFVIHFDLLLIV